MSKYEIKEREIIVKLAKKEADWWPRLLYEQQKLPWLKIDFDRWKGQDDSDELDEEEMEDNLVSSKDLLRNKYPEVYKQLQKDEMGFVSEGRRKIYLFCYNLFMFCGFLYVMAIIGMRFAKESENSIPGTYKACGNIVKMLHLFMFLEVLHPIFGYTKGSAVEAGIQVGGRNAIIFLLIEAEPRMQEKPVVFYIFIVYSIIELFRYPYYLLRVYDIEIDLLTWIRYTIWIPLYPAGFVCEGVIALRNIPYFEETEKFSIFLPNKWNFSFYFPTLLRVYLLFFFFPILYAMMNHMYQLRCKKLKIKQHPRNRPKKAHEE